MNGNWSLAYIKLHRISSQLVPNLKADGISAGAYYL